MAGNGVYYSHGEAALLGFVRQQHIRVLADRLEAGVVGVVPDGLPKETMLFRNTGDALTLPYTVIAVANGPGTFPLAEPR